MATATKHLEAIYQEITRQFAGNPSITVTPVDGDPPEKYEIAYQVKGIYKDNSGEIGEQESHVVTISIPFGFPHFPPSCKPKTPIFHPDFDPAAICIGDFWEKDRTIGDLIMHIGRMIGGHVFSTSNAFNEEAAKWYKDHPDRLPFDHRDFAVEADDDTFSLDESLGDDVTLLLEEREDDNTDPILSSFEEVLEPPPHDEHEPTDRGPSRDTSSTTSGEAVDTLDESFLENDYNFFGAEQKEPTIDELSPPPADRGTSAPAPIDLDRCKLLAKQKRFYELKTVLDGLSADQDFADKTRLSDQADSALQQARELYNQGTDHEHQGDPGKAYNAFKQVEKVVSDYPGLTEDLDRTAQAKELLGDWIETPQPSADREEYPAEEGTVLRDFDRGETAPRKSDTRTFFEDTARQSSKLIPYAIGVVLLIAVAAAAFSFFLNNARLNDAQKKFAECQTILKQNRFTEAERQCESALETASKVQFFRGGARDLLMREIETVLQSEVLHQGLAGNLFFDGRYLPKDVVKSVRAFNHFVKEGDSFFANQDWQQAVANYDQALTLAAGEPSIDQELVFAITEKQKTARFNTLLRSGEEYIRLEKWVLATADLENALFLAKDLTIENKAEIIASVTGKLEEISVATAKEKGDIAFAAQQWQDAVAHYRAAYEVAIKSAKRDDPATTEELKQLMVKAELYETINSGRNAFTSAEWDKAIVNYERAISILESNSDLLKQSNTEDNKKKLARTLLQAAVIRDKQEAAKFLKEKNYQAALDKLQTITTTIIASEFAHDPEFSATLKETEQAISQAKTDRLLADKISYLEEHFAELFTKHYTASPPESLVDPAVIFEKQVGDLLIFRLECTEIGRGRPLKLVMKYAHNLSNGQWRFYSGSN
ncbi:hypothetical protein [Desulfofustis limnaeus]|jgi:ubiquitin-protein ligase|nr:hypothetical protein [Desulfofustis limnaeus]MDX9893803.1 hypothetical protein [Desulfofustis sp.]